MLTFFCRNCGEKYYAEEHHAGHFVKCGRCGQIIPTAIPVLIPSEPAGIPRPARGRWHPASGTKPVTPVPERLRDYKLALIGICLLIALALYAGFSGYDKPRQLPPAGPPVRTEEAGPAPSPIARTPAEAREGEIVAQDAGRPGDPALNAEYQEINERHFANELPSMPVLWETRLDEVGPLIAEGFRLDGLAAKRDGVQFILINPVVRGYPGQLRRTLCHEMVHQYLFTKGDTTTKHGPAFQRILQRLSEEGAFVGKWASDSEKASLKAWLDGESTRLNGEKSELDRMRESIERDREELDRQVNELNQRISSANRQGSGWPSEEEVASVKSQRDTFNRSVEDYRDRGEAYGADAMRFNGQVNRYNLMISYPDRLDEESAVQARRTADVGGLRH